MIIFKNKIFSENENSNMVTNVGLGLASSGTIGTLSVVPGINKYKKLSNKKFESKFKKDYFDINGIGRKKIFDKLKNGFNNDLSSTRFTLSNENLLNPGAGHINNWKNTAEKFWGDKLWDKDDGIKINKDILTEDNLSYAKNRLDDNFSKEKWRDYKELNDKMLKDKTNYLIKEGSKAELNEFRLNKAKNLKKLKKLRRIRNVGIGVIGTGLGLAAGNELLKNKKKNDNIKTKTIRAY